MTETVDQRGQGVLNTNTVIMSSRLADASSCRRNRATNLRSDAQQVATDRLLPLPERGDLARAATPGRSSSASSPTVPRRPDDADR